MGHIHSNSEYDFTISGIIIHEDKALMLLHHKVNFWLSPGGHIELDETPMQALYREIEEETGLSKDHLTLLNVYTENLTLEREEGRNSTEPMPFDIDIHPIGTEGHRHIDFGYILRSDTLDVHRESGGAERLEWFTIDELKNLQPTTRSSISRTVYALERFGRLSAVDASNSSA